MMRTAEGDEKHLLDQSIDERVAHAMSDYCFYTELLTL